MHAIICLPSWEPLRLSLISVYNMHGERKRRLIWQISKQGGGGGSPFHYSPSISHRKAVLVGSAAKPEGLHLYKNHHKIAKTDFSGENDTIYVHLPRKIVASIVTFLCQYSPFLTEKRERRTEQDGCENGCSTRCQPGYSGRLGNRAAEAKSLRCLQWGLQHRRVSCAIFSSCLLCLEDFGHFTLSGSLSFTTQFPCSNSSWRKVTEIIDFSSS